MSDTKYIQAVLMEGPFKEFFKRREHHSGDCNDQQHDLDWLIDHKRGYLLVCE